MSTADMSTRNMESGPTRDDAPREGAPEESRWGEIVRKWAGPAALALIGSAGLIGALQLGVGTGERPGVGMWPAIVSAVILTSGVLMGRQIDTERIVGKEARQTLSALVLLTLFIVLFGLVGIFFPTLIVLTLWLKFLADRTWVKSLIIAAATAAGFYLIFTQIFGVGS